MIKKKNFWVFTVLFALLSIACFFANPDLLKFHKDYDKIITHPNTSPSVLYKQLESQCEPTTQYRYDAQRTGAAPDDFQPRVQAAVFKHIRTLNVNIHNASKSSPIVDETGVYVGSDSGWFFKMSHQGKILWRFYVPGSLNGIHGSAAMDSKKVYIGAYNGFLYALDKNNGDLVWTNPVGHYIGASPLLADGALFISAETYHPNGLVAKLDCNTGQPLWTSQWLGGHSHSSPAFDKTTQQIFAGSNSGRLYAFDVKTGKTLWEKQVHGQIKGTPLIYKDKVLFGSWDKNYHALDTKNGKTLWTTFMGGRIQTSLTHVPGTQVGVTNTKVGDIVGLSLTDGEILWRLRHGDRNHQFSILVTQSRDRKSYLAWSRCKEFKLCILDAEKGNLIRNLDLPGTFTSVPFAYEDQIYISLDKMDGLVILK